MKPGDERQLGDSKSATILVDDPAQLQAEARPPSALAGTVASVMTPEEVGSYEGVGYSYDDEGYLVVLCPLGVVNHRNGEHACNPISGKHSLSLFKSLGYCAETNTSLVECRYQKQ